MYDKGKLIHALTSINLVGRIKKGFLKMWHDSTCEVLEVLTNLNVVIILLYTHI